MAYSNYARNSQANLQWLKFLAKPILFVLFGFGAVAGFKFWKWRKSKPVDIEKEADKITGSKELQNIARELAHHLGTKYFWLNFRNWTENDKEAFELVVNLSQGEFDQVALLYNQIYAVGNDLKADLIRLLDTKYKEQLTLL